MIFGPFWSKLVYILPILVWNWVWILGKLREWMYVYLLFQFQMNTEKERTIIYDFKVDFKTSFIWCSNLSNDDIFIS